VHLHLDGITSGITIARRAKVRKDHVIVRLSALLGPEWLQAYALVDLKPSVDVDSFRFEFTTRMTYHHETEKYVGGVPGDLFVGFFAKGQVQLYEELSKIRAMPEVAQMKDWAVANFPTKKAEITALDWKIIKSLRSDSQKNAASIAMELDISTETTEARLDYIKNIPLGLSIEPPNEKIWSFCEIGFNFIGTTLKEKISELAKIGKPFGAATSGSAGALMVEPKSIEELQEMIKRVAAVDGVKVAGYAFCEDMIWNQPWLDRFIDDQIEAMERQTQTA
jgi:hypothetical protein